MEKLSRTSVAVEMVTSSATGAAPAPQGVPANAVVALRRERYASTTFVFVYDVIPAELASGHVVDAMGSLQNRLPDLPEFVVAMSRPSSAMPGQAVPRDASGKPRQTPAPSPGETVKLSWEEGSRFFEQTAICVTACDQASGIWHAVPVGEASPMAQRQAIHVECDFPVMAHVVGADGKAVTASAVAIDVSEGGLRVRLPPPGSLWAHLRREDAITVEFDLSFDDDVVRHRSFAGQVTHTSKERDDGRPDVVGVRFLNLTSAERDEIRRLVFVEQTRERRQQRYGTSTKSSRVGALATPDPKVTDLFAKVDGQPYTNAGQMPIPVEIPPDSEVVLRRQRFTMSTFSFVYDVIPVRDASPVLVEAMAQLRRELPRSPELVVALSRPTTVQASSHRARESVGRALPMPSPVPGEWLHLCWEDPQRFYEQPCVAITGCDRTSGTWHAVPVGHPVLISQRQVIHVECDFPVSVHVEDAEGYPVTATSLALDVSEGGLRIRLPGPAASWSHLQQNEPLEIIFDADFGDREIRHMRFRAEISHTTAQRGDRRPDIVGVRFVEFTPADRLEMRRFVFVQRMRMRRDKRYGGRR